ncbi:hypothetical protein RUM44_000332 [Polyplax serrata]|uniref:Constitutive coactivator of PPAR-gamma-like protein 1 n=1 Tax=Polyplax serrata TaxID=468196 RepID=A0ABR1B557_POLSC
MGVQNLQNFIEAEHVEGGAVAVELSKIARSISRPNNQNRNNKPNSKKLFLILDAECCLDRLYGGYFSDWTCGGQWNRMFQYLSHLVMSCQKGNIELTVAFNGALEPHRLNEWTQKQLKNKGKVNLVLRHIQNKMTPPPKVWWIPPVCLVTALRMALRYCNVPVICSVDDHHQEVLAYCRKNNLHGIVGDDAEYIVFDPPRYFSAAHLKLTYKGLIETKEFLISQLAKGLELTVEKLCILAALLGNYLLSEQQLSQFHKKIGVSPSKNPLDQTIRSVAAYVKTLENTENLEALAVEIFGPGNTGIQKKRQAFVECVQYYLNGTKDGFLKYSSKKSTKGKSQVQKDEEKKKKSDNGGEDKENVDNSKFASETAESEAGSIAAYKIATAMAQTGNFNPELLESEPEKELKSVNGVEENLLNGNNGITTTSPPKTEKIVVQSNSGNPSSTVPSAAVKQAKIPTVPPEVLRTACERHRKGLMSPFIYQILTQGEIKLPVLIEEDSSREWQSIHSVYKPIRQNVYAILFNLHHQMYIANKESNKENGNGDQAITNPPEILIREWVCTAMNQYSVPDIVKAEPVGWPVPTVQRLWFAGTVDEMRRRLRAYLTCMKSDSALMVCSSYVPQHLLLMASVLRYLMQVKPPILTKPELDAFIVTAFSPDLMNTEFIQDLQLQMVSSRAVQLATLFMQGVETALLANDACGAPIPWLMCCPWLFFDGKLFHNILAKTELVKSLQELCNHRLDILVKVERMRHAILESLNVKYARRRLPAMSGIQQFPTVSNIPPTSFNPADLDVTKRINPRGPPQRPIPTRGGQLEVAGIVVGNWGPNYSLSRPKLAMPQVSPLLRTHNRNNYHSERPYFLNYGTPSGVSIRKFQRRRPGTGTKKSKTKKAEKKKETRGKEAEEGNANVEKVGDTLGTCNSEEIVEQLEAAAVTEIESKVAAVSLERGQGDHVID